MMKKSKIFKSLLLSMGFIPFSAIAISVPPWVDISPASIGMGFEKQEKPLPLRVNGSPPPFLVFPPAAVIGFDHKDKPVVFCRINLNMSLVCFNKEAKEFDFGVLVFGNTYKDWHLKSEKSKSRYVLETRPSIVKLAYSHFGKRDYFRLPEPIQHIKSIKKRAGSKNIISSGLEILHKQGSNEIFLFDDDSNNDPQFVGEISPPIWNKMITPSASDRIALKAEAERFRAATMPGYNLHSSDSSSSSCNNNDFQSSGNVSGANGGTIGGMDSSGNISGTNGGYAGHVGADGNISNRKGNVGQIDSDGNIGTSHGYVGRVDAGGTVTLGNKVIGYFDAKSGNISGTNGGIIGHVPPCNRALAFEMLSKKLGN